VFVIREKLLLTYILIYLAPLSGQLDSDDEVTTIHRILVTIYRLIWRTKSKVMAISGQPSPVQIIMDQKQPETAEYLNYLGSVTTHVERCTCEIKFRISIAKAAFHKRGHFTPANCN
jgi:hypothetical protein